jgi:hypothetical protein
MMFSLDFCDFNKEDYGKAPLAQRVDHLKRTFEEFTENIDWINEHEGLGLERGGDSNAQTA